MIYFIRHGETDWNVRNTRQGWTGNSLNAKGRQQVEQAVSEIVKLKPAYFYSSDLMRARESAQIINKTLKMPIVFDMRLREFNHGIMAGSGKGEHNEFTQGIINDFLENPHKYGAESKQDSFNRAKDFVINELSKKKIDNAIIVCHGGIMGMFKYIESNKEFNHDKWLNFMEQKRTANAEIVPMNFYKLYGNE